MSASNLQNLIVISGYYGFNNLGDEAILEELIEELKELTESENIVVLSNNPEKLFRVGSLQHSAKFCRRRDSLSPAVADFSKMQPV